MSKQDRVRSANCKDSSGSSKGVFGLTAIVVRPVALRAAFGILVVVTSSCGNSSKHPPVDSAATGGNTVATGGGVSTGGTVGTGGFGGLGGTGGGSATGVDSSISGDSNDATIDINLASATGGVVGSGGKLGTGGTGGVGGTCGTQPSLSIGAFLVEDFENGPGVRGAAPNACTIPQFNGAMPSVDGGVQQCDFVGFNPSACSDLPFCDGSYGGICPAFIGREECPWRGSNALRLFYNVDKDKNGSAFAGITFNISNQQDSQMCQVNRTPVDLTHFDYLSLRVRPGDGKGNAEVALQDVHSGPNGLVETNPKMVLVSSPVNSNRFVPPLVGNMLPQGQWTEVQIRVCDLLRRTTDDGGVALLDRTAITKVFIDFAKNRFIGEGTDLTGTRQMDVDDIVFLPCATTGCLPCL